MILSFADQDTADLFAGVRVKRFVNMAAVAQRRELVEKLQQIGVVEGALRELYVVIKVDEGWRGGSRVSCSWACTSEVSDRSRA